MTPIVKLVISNRIALQNKYGDKHPAILEDLESLREHDKGRQLDTRIVYVDDATQMASMQATPVTDHSNQEQYKRAVDELCAFLNPSYIMLAGAQDVIPFQKLENLLSGEDDPDRFIPSDMPYACDAPYDTDPGKFIAPTRVVGRLPDVPGQNDPAYFRSLIQDILTHQPVPAQETMPYFSLSTFDWQDSTQTSIKNIFGNNSQLHIIPGSPDATKWSEEQLRPQIHFYNCHGALNDPSYYGQKSYEFPPAIHSVYINGLIKKGTVVAAECCYGGQLFNPQSNASQQLSVANSYMLNHAIAFIGSTTISYGPATGQGLADLLTQFFVINVMGGASTGRALLEARQRFLHEMGPTLDPYELKTAAQFYLLGDPSLVPICNEKDAGITTTCKSFVNTVQNRRDNLQARGEALDNFIAPPTPADPAPQDPSLKGEISQLLDERNFGKSLNAAVFSNRKKKPAEDGRKEAAPSVKFHVYSESAATAPSVRIKVLIVKERYNQILGYREYVSR